MELILTARVKNHYREGTANRKQKRKEQVPGPPSRFILSLTYLHSVTKVGDKERYFVGFQPQYRKEIIESIEGWV